VEVYEMPTWAWVLVAVVVGLFAAGLLWQLLSVRRTRLLRERFGPEYERTVDSRESKRDAEAELQAREERRKQLDIRPLAPAARDGYLELWQRVQSQFVDDPAAAVSSADRVIQQVMGERGYPVEDFEQRVTDVSVDHPQVVEHYRQAHAIADSSAQHDASTEDLRQAMRHYRALFDDLLETSADEPLTRDATASEPTAMERMRRS
jgi:hypothetical protein